MSDKFLLISGNLDKSSWSMRAWLMLKMVGINFETKIIDLSLANYKSKILEYSPAGKVPVLVHNDLHIWESLAIGEYLNELFPEVNLYPSDAKERAIARSLVNEMHAGFMNIRSSMPFTLIQQEDYTNSSDLQTEILRIEQIWSLQRIRYKDKGEFLFGKFSLVDIMYAPVVIRFAKYGYVSKNLEVLQYSKSIMEYSLVETLVQELSIDLGYLK